MIINELQEQVGQWSRQNFGDQPNATNQLLGLVEEVGELSHAHLKGIQGIRHTPADIFDLKFDAVGDIVIYLADYCDRSGIDLASAVDVTWHKIVSRRDWKADPVHGTKVPGSVDIGTPGHPDGAQLEPDPLGEERIWRGQE